MYEFDVRGSDDYVVRLTVKDNVVADYTCDCPYDRGSVCKHVAASIFYLQKDVLDLGKKETDAKKVIGKKTDKKKTIAEQINDLLNNISHEDIKQYIRKKAEEESTFRNTFLATFAHKNNDESKEIYIKQIKSILNNAEDRHGFIDWSAVRKTGREVGGLLDTAQEHFDNNNYKSCVFICCAVMEQMTEALQYADDSNGDVGGCIETAYEILDNVVSEKITEEMRKELFEYFMSSFEKEIFSDWDWHFGMLYLAVKIVTNEEEAQAINFHLDTKQFSEYDKNRAHDIKLRLIKKTKGEKESEKYLEENIDNSDFRCEVIRKAIKNKDFEKAIKIAKEGIVQNEKVKTGLLSYWYDFLLQIAQIQKDKDKIIEYARIMFLRDFGGEQDYYKVLKNTVPLEKWTDFVESILKEVIKRGRYSNHFISEIYIKEGLWNRLLDLVTKEPSLSEISHYEKYLSKDYSSELVQLYDTEIKEHLKYALSREQYKDVCRYIRRMIKLGAREKANELIAYLRKEYPRRKALMEELNRV
jgi:hypothetical protein